MEKGEPLRLELENFLECVRTRATPLVTGRDATKALKVALSILAKIEEHGSVVAETVRQQSGNPVNLSFVSI